jgi:hypothetical protein
MSKNEVKKALDDLMGPITNISKTLETNKSTQNVEFDDGDISAIISFKINSTRKEKLKTYFQKKGMLLGSGVRNWVYEKMNELEI